MITAYSNALGKSVLIDFAQYASLELLGDGEAKQKMRKFEDDLQVAKKEMGQSQANLEGTKRLFGKGFVTKIDLERDEIAFENAGIDTDKLNFATDKNGMLNNLSMDVSNHLWKWPPILGLTKQMTTYSLEMDKDIPQYIVVTLAEISYLSRMIQGDIQTQDQATNVFQQRYIRNRYARTTHTNRR